MRSLHTLYKIVLSEAIKNNRSPKYGICHLIQDAKFALVDKITFKEEERLDNHFKANRPHRSKGSFKEFAHDKSYRWDEGKNRPSGAYWWDTDEEGKVQRYLFLNALIEYTAPWYIKVWRKVVNFKLFI